MTRFIVFRRIMKCSNKCLMAKKMLSWFRFSELNLEKTLVYLLQVIAPRLARLYCLNCTYVLAICFSGNHLGRMLRGMIWKALSKSDNQMWSCSCTSVDSRRALSTQCWHCWYVETTLSDVYIYLDVNVTVAHWIATCFVDPHLIRQSQLDNETKCILISFNGLGMLTLATTMI